MSETRPPETLAINPADLAPGDQRAADVDFTRYAVHLIRSSSHPLFDVAYQKLWDEFGSHGGMELRDVIVARLKLDPAVPVGNWRFLYRMIAIMHGDKAVAVRDCTAISDDRHAEELIVHLSHLLVDADFRRTGLAAWMRAFPIQIARKCHAAAGGAGAPPITLVAEMEYPTPHEPMTLKRLGSYEKAGFLKIDPSRVRYVQPDFRDPAEIDSCGGPKPLPYQLVVRRVGRETERIIDAAEVRRLMTSLYSMYAQGFRPQDMQAAVKSIDRLPPPQTNIHLLPPLA